jgi:hypothetical protein
MIRPVASNWSNPITNTWMGPVTRFSAIVSLQSLVLDRTSIGGPGGTVITRMGGC